MREFDIQESESLYWIFFFQPFLITPQRLYYRIFDNWKSYLIGWVIMEILSWFCYSCCSWGLEFLSSVGFIEPNYISKRQLVIRFALVSDQISSWTGWADIYSLCSPERKKRKEKEYLRQISESKQSEVKLGRKFGTEWRLFTGQIRGFVFGQRIRANTMKREGEIQRERERGQFDVGSSRTDPQRTSSGERRFNCSHTYLRTR